jgi:hypothetical protein
MRQFFWKKSYRQVDGRTPQKVEKLSLSIRKSYRQFGLGSPEKNPKIELGSPICR